MALKLKGGGSALENLSLPGKIAVGVVFFVLVGAAYFIIFYSDVEGEITSQTTRVSQLKRELEDAKKAKVAFNRDLTRKKRLELLVDRQKKILPDEAQTPAFLSTVQNVATISGVELRAWTPEDQKVEQFYARVPMSLTLGGKFHQIAKFFHGIGQVDRIINMENIAMEVVAPKGKGKKGDPRKSEVAEAVFVKVKCLSTAFRALQSSEQGKKKKGKRKR